MITDFRKNNVLFITTGLFIFVLTTSARSQDASSVGVVRISDGAPSIDYGNSPCQNCQSSGSQPDAFLRDIESHKRRRFGYFHPSGCNGQGCQRIDHFSMVYATLPEYFDSRDGRVFAAQGFNIPVSVPLAPNVRHTYNYGWGIPSSRRTPVSRFIPEGPMRSR